MASPNPIPTHRDDVDAGVTDRLVHLEEAVAALARELTTRRLVVVDEQGRPRITAEVAGEVAELRVELAGTAPGHGTAVVCFAAPEDPATGLSAGVGLQCWENGECVDELTVYDDRPR